MSEATLPTKGKGERNIYCLRQGECVDLAAKQGWRSFHCQNCPLFADVPDYINPPENPHFSPKKEEKSMEGERIPIEEDSWLCPECRKNPSPGLRQDGDPKLCKQCATARRKEGWKTRKTTVKAQPGSNGDSLVLISRGEEITLIGVDALPAWLEDGSIQEGDLIRHIRVTKEMRAVRRLTLQAI